MARSSPIASMTRRATSAGSSLAVKKLAPGIVIIVIPGDACSVPQR